MHFTDALQFSDILLILSLDWKALSWSNFYPIQILITKILSIKYLGQSIFSKYNWNRFLFIYIGKYLLRIKNTTIWLGFVRRMVPRCSHILQYKWAILMLCGQKKSFGMLNETLQYWKLKCWYVKYNMYHLFIVQI